MVWLTLAALLALVEGHSVTALRQTPLPIYDDQGRAIGTLSGSQLPALPIPIRGTNEFGDLQIMAGGRVVYVRPADVRNDMPVCGGRSTVRREGGGYIAGGTPGGVRRGGGEDDGECVH